jgi:hypothetical protein
MINLQSIALPARVKSLAFVQAIFKHGFSSSKVAEVVKNVRSMQSEIRTCLEELKSSFGHVNDLYNLLSNRFARTTTTASVSSTSTALTVRVKLAGWLKRRERTWGLPSRGRSTKVRLVALRVVLRSHFDFSFQNSLRPIT